MTDQDARDLIARLRGIDRTPYLATLCDEAADALDRLLRERGEAARLKRLVEHIWLHVTADEDFDADELRRDIERGGTVDELAGAIRQREAAEQALASLRAQIIDECARVADGEGEKAIVLARLGEVDQACATLVVMTAREIAKAIRSLSPPSPSTIEGEQGR